MDRLPRAWLTAVAGLGLVAGYGLLTVTGDEHRQMRRSISPAFSIPSLMARTWELADQ